MATASSSPRTVEEIFKDFTARRCALIRALTTEVDQLYLFCDPEKENLSLYGHPNEVWEVAPPPEEVPPELPEPALGINFARDGMHRKDWLSLVAVHSDSWLLSVAFYFGARLSHNDSILQDTTLFIIGVALKALSSSPFLDDRYIHSSPTLARVADSLRFHLPFFASFSAFPYIFPSSLFDDDSLLTAVGPTKPNRLESLKLKQPSRFVEYDIDGRDFKCLPISEIGEESLSETCNITSMSHEIKNNWEMKPWAFRVVIFIVIAPVLASETVGLVGTGMKRLFSLLNDLPTLYEVVTGRKAMKDKPNADSRSKSRNSTKRSITGQLKNNSKSREASYEEDEDSEHNTLCGSCGDNYNADEFWIGCDICEQWYHGKCVKITPAKAESIKQYKCPSCSLKKGRQ
ncbi:hypothetical protein JRO89_XS14G0111100 [Xanthoceras sorbifolium]|uniref:PHD finger protein ALFIN-LIKE n=1 Tax=Xanthoceras sorbifolium TaxID=99658 RepID=A0ABQ8H511_9ROSI|nr:hypothetical protein JRO89_XS14G0111100 [Xanthoceras sorbifolium]